jgi:hypothetical protein
MNFITVNENGGYYMQFKKLVCCAIVTAMVVSAIAGCGSTANIDDTEVVEATESIEIETEVVTETEEESEEPTEEMETETEPETEVGTESSATADTSKANTETTVAHTHSWDGGTVTQAATCTGNGVKTYTCSCGETKTETINATGHNWVAQTTTVHHDAEGVNQQVKTGTVKVIICDCDQKFYDTASWEPHHNETHHGGTVTTEDTYETQWVETSPAYDETVTTGYICSVCGTAQ